MPHDSNRLSAADCRREATLESFLSSRVSPNSWPIHSRPLCRLLRKRGLDLDAGRRFTLSVDRLEAMMQKQRGALERVERMLGIDNAFHHRLHNYDVLMRMYLLEWPRSERLPVRIRRAAERVYPRIESIIPVLRGVAQALLDRGVPSRRLARATLAALGHDYGHTGGSERVDSTGRPTRLSHEEVAEKHTAKLGLAFDLPPGLILESLAGIRATTFHTGPESPKIRPATEFEIKLALADRMGCALPADQWLTYVAVPILKEKISSGARGQNVPIARDVEDFFAGELRFLISIESDWLERVPAAAELWGEAVATKIALLEKLCGRERLLAPLARRGFEFLADFAESLARAPSLERWIAMHPEDEALNTVLSRFLEPAPTAPRGFARPGVQPERLDDRDE